MCKRVLLLYKWAIEGLPEAIALVHRKTYEIFLCGDTALYDRLNLST